MAGGDQVARYNYGLIIAPKASVLLYDRFNSEVGVLIAQMESSNLSPLRDACRSNEHRAAANRRDHLLRAVESAQKRQDPFIFGQDCRTLCTAWNQCAYVVSGLGFTNGFIDIEVTDGSEKGVNLNRLFRNGNRFSFYSKFLDFDFGQKVLGILKRVCYEDGHFRHVASHNFKVTIDRPGQQ